MINQRGFSARLFLKGCALNVATRIKTTSAITAPISTQKACFAPFVMLVSTITKKTGPVEKTSNNDREIAAKNSLIFWSFDWVAFLFNVAAYCDSFN